jgi:hypothetical protein
MRRPQLVLHGLCRTRRRLGPTVDWKARDRTALYRAGRHPAGTCGFPHDPTNTSKCQKYNRLWSSELRYGVCMCSGCATNHDPLSARSDQGCPKGATSGGMGRMSTQGDRPVLLRPRHG